MATDYSKSGATSEKPHSTAIRARGPPTVTIMVTVVSDWVTIEIRAML